MTDFSPRVFSGIKPSGGLTLGNYLGAIKRFVAMQGGGFETIYCVVDLHAITVWQDPAELAQATREVAAGYLATGIDPARSILFNQAARARARRAGLDLQLRRPDGLDEPDDPVQGKGRQERREGEPRPVRLSRR